MEFVGEWREGVYVGFCGVNFEEVGVGGRRVWDEEYSDRNCHKGSICV